MKHLINREDYIREYLRIERNIEDDNKLNEGLIGTLFGGLKMLLKKDWENIKCKNPSVLKHLQAIDKSLGGYTMTKMQFSGECTTIRQNIADYFNDILDYKLGQIEKEENPEKFLKQENKEKEDSKEEGVAKHLNLKDKTLLDSIKKYKENISVACKPSPKLREYADMMLNSIEIFVNDIILAELEKKGLEKAKIEEEEKKNEEKRRKMEEEQKKKNEESRKAEEEAMKKLEKERDDAIRSLGVKPIGNMDGDKAIDTIAKQYSDMLGELKNNADKVNESALPQDYSDLLKSDTYVGISKSLEELNWDADKKEDELYNKFTIRVILNKINTAFNVISDNKTKELFKGVPSASVQAMMMSLSNAVLYGFVGDKFKIKSDEARLSLMTKCAIDSDATIGFNLPLIDPKKPDNGNYFVSIMNQFRSADISSQEVDDAIEMMSKRELKDIKSIWGDGDEKKSEEMSLDEFAKEFGPDLMKAFRQNMSNLFDMIVSKSKQIKEDAQKAREAEAAKAQQESETNEKSE
jgi:hypothetical protein